MPSSFPLRVADSHQSQPSGDALKISLRVAPGLPTVPVFSRERLFLQSLPTNLKREKINVGAVGIIGTFTRIIKRENPFFMLFSCLFILFSFFVFFASCSFYFEPFFVFTLISVISGGLSSGEHPWVTLVFQVKRWFGFLLRKLTVFGFGSNFVIDEKRI